MKNAEHIEYGGIKKLPTGIQGFDQVANGGLPEGRATIITGTAGSGKTILALQFLVAGVRQFDESGVIVTFEESPSDLIQNVASFGWDIASLIRDKRISIVDATPDPGQETIETGPFDLSALLARIENAIRAVNAKRVILDAVGGLFPQFTDSSIVRREVQRIGAGLRRFKTTTIITMERTEEDGRISRFGVEEFVVDNVILLRNRIEQEKRRRTIEILKFRGATHRKGEYPFTIDPDEGVAIIPLPAIEVKHKTTNDRISSGVKDLDRMCGGGFYRDSVILVSGATGTGKSLMVAEYLKAAIESGERALLFGTEESREQILRNANSWGIDFENAEQAGLLRIHCRYPEIMGLEDHLIQMKREIKEFDPKRIAIDSLSAFERIYTLKSYREFVIGLTTHVKLNGITGLFTNTSQMLIGGGTITETHISTITDTVILLRYVELYGQMRRGLTVLKMRGTWHEKEIREYVIDNTGMHVRDPFRGVQGILTGALTYNYKDERERLEEMFGQSDKPSE